MDSRQQASTSIATTKEPLSQSSVLTRTISLVDTLLFLGTAVPLSKTTRTCSSSPSATLTTFLPPSTPSNQSLAVESTVIHHVVQSLGEVTYLSSPTRIKPTTTTPSSRSTTPTPMGQKRTPSLAQRTSLPTRLKSTLFSEGNQKREGTKRKRKKKIECLGGECMDD